MPWIKLGDELPNEARKLSDAAFRTHVEALAWSNRNGSDLRIEAADLPRFAWTTADAAEVVEELVAGGWWSRDGDVLFIGLRHPEWQLSAAVVEQRRRDAALRQDRRRRHKAGDHAFCLPDNCPEAPGNPIADPMGYPEHVTRDVTRDVTGDNTRDPGRDGTGRVLLLEEHQQEEDQERARDVTRDAAEPGPPEGVTRDQPRDAPEPPQVCAAPGCTDRPRHRLWTCRAHAGDEFALRPAGAR